MTEKLFDKDGNEVEAFTQEDVDAKEKEVRDEEQKKAKEDSDKSQTEAEAKTEQERVAAALANSTGEQLKTQLDEARAELTRMESKDFNWEQARKQGKEKDEVIAEQKSSILDLTDRIEGAQTEGIVEAVAEKLSNGDDEVKKKILFNFKRLGATPKETKDIETQMGEAYILTTGDKMPDALANVMGSAGAGGSLGDVDTGGGSSRPPLTEGQRDLATHFGLTDEDIKTYDK